MKALIQDPSHLVNLESEDDEEEFKIIMEYQMIKGRCKIWYYSLKCHCRKKTKQKKQSHSLPLPALLLFCSPSNCPSTSQLLQQFVFSQQACGKRVQMEQRDLWSLIHCICCISPVLLR